MITDDNITIKEARNRMRPLLKKGTVCQCCGLKVKMYSRTITSAMAYGLVLMYKESHKVVNHAHYFIHIEDFFKSLPYVPASIRGDLPKLRFWNLLQPDGQEGEDGNPSNGMYKLTDLGKKFVEGIVSVPRHVKIYNNRFFGYEPSTGQISIQEALKNKFNYEKLIKGEL